VIFPLAASAVAALKFAAVDSNWFSMGGMVLALGSVVIAALLVRTLVEAVKDCR
jgi:tellurite resistance protein TehA-like permease